MIRIYATNYGSDSTIRPRWCFISLRFAGVIRLRFLRPQAERPYRVFGYPVLPALYVAGAAVILAVLFAYRPSTTFPGAVIVLVGMPVYFAFRRLSARGADLLKGI